MKNNWIFLILTVWLAACLPTPLPVQQPRTVTAGDRLLHERFDQNGTWDTYADPRYTITVADGFLNLLLRDAGTFLWTTNGQSVDNAIVEFDLQWLSDTPTAMAGVICRLSPSRDGTGYYVLISRDGSYAIRYGGRSRDEALVRWQPNRHIPSDGQPLALRVICVEDYIALYVNGNYIGAATDRRLSGGYVGIVTGLPPATVASDVASIQIDTLRIWQGALAE